jgi:hypothetical protein
LEWSRIKNVTVLTEVFVVIELKFDANGNLLPHTHIFLDINEIEFNLVNSIPSSLTRKIIFDGYKKYCRDISAVIKFEIEQWIDGSFITNKVNPNDIDLVNCIPIGLLDV